MNRILPSITLAQTSQATAPKAAAAVGGAKAAGQNTGAAPDFTDLLGNMLNEVSVAQAKSSEMNRRLQMGDPKATVEDTVLAMNTASVQFQMVVQVRNKLVQSYTDIMNMPV